MFFIFLLPLASLSFAQVSNHEPFYCYARDPLRPQRRMFGIPAHYDDVRGNALETSLSTCSPSKLWLIARGGTRYPGASLTDNMVQSSNRIQADLIESIDAGMAQLCRPDADALLNWRFNQSINAQRAHELTATGWSEMRNLASRLQIAFPQILPQTYNQTLFRFRHTTSQRTHENLHAIAEGLFGHRNVVFDDIPSPDTLLWPVQSCRLFDEWSINFHERDAFTQSIDFLQMTDQVNRKLGLIGSKQLTFEQLNGTIDLCRFEHSWNPTGDSAWCAGFSIANHEVLEYLTDLLTYYTTGYGGDERLFPNLNCHAMQDLLQFIQSNNPDDQRARFHVTHSNVLRLFFTTLGVFRDEVPPTRHNIAHQAQRQWKTSIIAAHASNIVFVKHECSNDDNDIVILHNERPLHIPGCERPGVCKQETFLRLFSRFLNANCANLYCSRD